MNGKRVLVIGIDGYIGWSLAMHLAKRGHKVAGIDNYSRRRNVAKVGSISATPIREMEERIHVFNMAYPEASGRIGFKEGDLLDYGFIRDYVNWFKPDTIVHLGEQPSAPFSMIDREHAVYTQQNNVIGNLNLLYAIKEIVPDCHLLKLGTMGEYGYDTEFEIPEGFFEVEYKGKKATIPFPRLAGSWYHWSKVHDSNNIMFACKLWGIRSTDVMQGIVYGTRTKEMVADELLTRFDFDECFGTAINRFCAQAVIGHKLTPYGKGGQTRGYLALTDSIQCLTIATENPPEKGEYRVFNQLDKTYKINDLANTVQKIAKKNDMDVKIESIENPRVEKEVHIYKVQADKLRKLGFRETRTLEEEVDVMLTDLKRFKNRILAKKEVILPKPYWRQANHLPVLTR
ncbi:MAG TPA: UDP-sulfoquinovose synthase [Nitrososphaera sp.]|jgi:nucleoside-diphosphate-sugar epimerase|nr:UDP-sulfoquinovose synthase [Nitrososphaera sp.]